MCVTEYQLQVGKSTKRAYLLLYIVWLFLNPSDLGCHSLRLGYHFVLDMVVDM